MTLIVLVMTISFQSMKTMKISSGWEPSEVGLTDLIVLMEHSNITLKKMDFLMM